MVSMAGFDDDFNVGVIGGEVDEMRGGLDVGAEGGGRASVFAIADVEFLKLLDSSGCHFFVYIEGCSGNVVE